MHLIVTNSDPKSISFAYDQFGWLKLQQLRVWIFTSVYKQLGKSRPRQKNLKLECITEEMRIESRSVLYRRVVPPAKETWASSKFYAESKLTIITESCNAFHWFIALTAHMETRSLILMALGWKMLWLVCWTYFDAPFSVSSYVALRQRKQFKRSNDFS